MPSHGTIALDGKCVADTLQCCHCNKHFIVEKGSGNRRGFCMHCMGPTCGDYLCDTCIPFEKKLDLFEKGKIKVLR